MVTWIISYWMIKYTRLADMQKVMLGIWTIFWVDFIFVGSLTLQSRLYRISEGKANIFSAHHSAQSFVYKKNLSGKNGWRLYRNLR